MEGEEAGIRGSTAIERNDSGVESRSQMAKPLLNQ